MEPTPAKQLRRIGAAIRHARTAARLTQEQVAERAGLSPHYISNLERGMQEPRVGVLLRVGAAIGLRANVLLRRAGF